MGKGHRHLKKLKSEKAKVKLKGSKQLPKGTNVTDTNFKIKQIVIPEQLKLSNDAEPLSKRKLNIKELLSRLQHYNTTVKTGAITDLKEIVSLYPQDVVVPNLNQLIHGVSHLVLDKEKTVRQDSLKLISLILTQVTVEQITPFFDIMGSYFRCAMTHIDIAIQEDSLLLLDILLIHVPSLVAVHSNKILDNFFDLISKLRSDSKPGRTLTLNLGSKLTTVKWRIKVLNRLYSILEAIIKSKENNRKENIINSVDHNINQIYYPVYQTFSTCLISLNQVKNKTKNEENNIVKNIDVLVPLLFETWLEVGPNEEENNELDITLTDEACAVLNCILNIFYLLHTFLQIHSKDTDNYDMAKKFILKYRKDFSKYIITYFPYTRILSKKRKRNEKNNYPNGPQFCAVENLIICNLFCIFNSRINSENKQRENAEKITNYLKSIFINYNSENIDNKFGTLILRNLLLQVSSSWSCCKNDLIQILNSVLNMYASNKSEFGFKQELFNILCELVNNKIFNNSQEYHLWLNTLPDLLCQKEVNLKTIIMIVLLAKQKNEAFNNILKEKFGNILKNISNIKVTNTKHEINAKYNIISLIQYISPENINDFIKIMSQTNCEDSLKKYFRDIIILMYEEKYETISAEKIRICKIK